jgi:hypothetical protein
MRSITRPVLAAITTAMFLSVLALDPNSLSANSCPNGYERRDPVAIAREFQPQLSDRAAALIREREGSSICTFRHLPESAMEIKERNEDPGRANVPAGVLRRAVEQKQKMIDAGTQSRVPSATAATASGSAAAPAGSPQAASVEAAQQKVANAPGNWKPYGKGPEVSRPEYPGAYLDGIPVVAGRVDSFAYDSVAKRLFAAVTYAGVWMSEAKDGDVGTLGDKWVAIGDGLPTLINSAVAWTQAKGGRVLTLTGEHTQGGNTYVGLGGYWSDDLGKTWHRSLGLPDGAGAARLAVDLSNPMIIYAATHKGLFRSTNAGDSFVNVRLPVSATCAGVVQDAGPCQLANIVTDVAIRQPGGSDSSGAGTTCHLNGCSVIAAVGYRAGNKIAYLDGTPQSPGNGLYRSETGEPGTWVKLNPASLNPGDTGGMAPVGFTPPARIGRVEMSTADGPQQNHNYLYAIVQDAVLLNKGIPAIDLPTDTPEPSVPLDCSGFPPDDRRFICETITAGLSPTTINGVYVSPDFGDTWIRLADDLELTYNPSTGSTLAWVVPLGIGPGVQAWYDLWIKPDPTQAVGGVPSRLAFGMEEIWKNRLNIPITGLEQTTNDFRVFGTYFAGTTCLFLVGRIGPGTPVCPTYDGVINGTTTHPDQHDGIFIPDDKRGGVWLFAGNDGGAYKQYSGDPITDDFANNKWGSGINQDFYTLFNYGISVAKDGTVWYGLQDNASGKIEKEGGPQIRTYVGDGVYTAVDPNNSKVAYLQTPELAIVRTIDGGVSTTSISPDDAAGAAHFLSPFRMDPRDPEHLVAAGTKVAEILKASTGGHSDWKTVFELGKDPVTETEHQSRSLALAVDGDAVYAGWCGPCNVLRAYARGGDDGTDLFQRGIATNVGGSKPAKKGTANGWHQASMKGLPNRYIYNIAIDPKDPRTVYVVLGNYSTTRWLDAPQYEDKNPNIGKGHVFKSTDAGEHFKDISGNLPDVITTAVIQAGNQLIIGTDIGAFISSDLQGSLWAPLGSLPNVPINELVLDPAHPNRVFAATWGRGVQTYTLYESASVLPSSQRRPPAEPKPRLPATGVGGADVGLVLLLLAAATARFNRKRRLV